MGRVYSLVAEQGDKEGKVFEVEIVPFSLPKGRTLNFQHITVSGVNDEDVRLSGEKGGSIAYEQLKKRGLVHKTSEIPQYGAVFYFRDCHPDWIKGPSAGLCFLVKMAQEIVEDFLRLAGKQVPSHDFAATGILNKPNSDWEIKKVGFLEEKIQAAIGILEDGATVFYPKANDPLDPDLRRQAAQKQVDLVAVDTAQQAIDSLLKKHGFRTEKPDRSSGWLKLVLLACLTVMVMGDKPLPVPSTVCAFEAALFYEGEKSEAVQLPEGKALTQGDGFRVRITLANVCFLYVFEVDGEHYISWLFPPPPSSPLLPGTVQWVPGHDRWIELDGVKGRETILIWATVSSSPWLEEMRKRIDTSEDLGASERSELKGQIENYLEQGRRERRGTLKRLTFRHG